MRSSEEGYVKIGITCSAGRRSLWVRINCDDNNQEQSIEICAGREGDDNYVKIERSNPAFRELSDVFYSAIFATET